MYYDTTMRHVSLNPKTNMNQPQRTPDTRAHADIQKCNKSTSLVQDEGLENSNKLLQGLGCKLFGIQPKYERLRYTMNTQ